MDTARLKNIMKLGRALAHAAMLVYILGVLFALVIGAPLDLTKIVLGYAIVFTSVLATGYTNNYYDAPSINTRHKQLFQAAAAFSYNTLNTDRPYEK